MEVYIGLFIVLLINDWFDKVRVSIKEKITYFILLVVSAVLAWIYFSDPFRPSILKMILKFIGR